MTKSIGSILVATAAAVALIIGSPVSGQGQDKQAKGKGKAAEAKGPNPDVKHAPIPRTADGKPDLSGTWQGGGVSINGEAGAPPLHPLPPIDTHTIRREPLVYKPAWEAKRGPLDAALDDPTLFCLLPGVPRISTMPMPLEIVQTPKQVVILHEAFRAWRRIPLEANLKHPDDLVPTWMGDSVGRWEGDTFVVDTVGFNDKSWIAGKGIHSEEMHVVEKYTLNTDGSLTFEAMVEDKNALEKPYYTGVILRRPIDVRVEEYECIENNPDPGHMNKAAGRAK
ncbi:MAG: hypothetical protein ABI995_10750 [Acidobacteriota bacterium]